MTGVTVVTTRDKTGIPVGFTANSFSSVSLDPPLLLVCPARGLTSFAVFNETDHFAVNILAEGQEHVSNTFAGYKGDRFAAVSWQDDLNGCPVIEGVAASFSCSLHDRVPAGDHIVMLGRIEAFSHAGRPGLGYGEGGYFSLGLERRSDTQPTKTRSLVVGAILEHEGHILLAQTPQGLRLPHTVISQNTGLRAELKKYFSDAGLDISLGTTYSIFEDRKTGEAFTYFRAKAYSGETGDLGTFMPIDDLSSKKFVTPTHATLIERYVFEYKTDSFGLYVGDEDEGEVHRLVSEEG